MEVRSPRRLCSQANSFLGEAARSSGARRRRLSIRGAFPTGISALVAVGADPFRNDGDDDDGEVAAAEEGAGEKAPPPVAAC